MDIFCSNNSGFYGGITSGVALVVQKQLCVHTAHTLTGRQRDVLWPQGFDG